MARRVLVSTSIIFLALATLLALAVLFSGRSTYPSDEALIRRFERNEAMFSELVSQLQARPDIAYLGYNVAFYDGRGRVTEPGEEKELRALMGRLRLMSVNPDDDDGPDVYMEITPSGGSLGSSNKTKGYARLSTPPIPVRTVGNLDAIGQVGAVADLYFYRHMKGNWYLYLKIQS